MLPVLFQSYFQYASSIHGYNTRYASKQNLYKPKERNNSGKQTVAFAASVLWDLMLPTHEKKEHQQQQMWGKGVGNEVLQQATIANTILV